MEIKTITKKGTHTTEFLDVNKKKGSERNPIEKSEIKFIENQSDKKICTEIDNLNESVFRLNNFLRLSKDIVDMKKENLVKDDIQRKLSLKSQWLSSKYGSTGSLNSSTATRPKSRKISCRNSGNSSSVECLEKNDNSDADGYRKKCSKSKTASIHCLVPIKRKNTNTLRLHRSFNELRFEMKPSMVSDTELGRNADIENSKAIDSIENDELKNLQKMIEVKNTIDRVKDAKSKYVEPKASTDPAKRDLSRFFPPKKETARASRVLRNPKELKDVDLSLYFLPSAVQELKSIPSPGQSPQLTRKMMSNVKHQPGSTISNLSKTLPETNLLVEDNLNKSEHMLNDQDVIVSNDLQVSKKYAYAEPEKRLSDKINDIACDSSLTGGEYIQLVESLKTPTDNIDKMFEEVAAALFDSPVSSEMLHCQKTKDDVENMDTSESMHQKVEHRNSSENIPKIEEDMIAYAAKADESTGKISSPMVDPNENAQASSSSLTIENSNNHDLKIDYENLLETSKTGSQKTNTIAEEENQNHRNNTREDTNLLSNTQLSHSQIPSDMLCKRQDHLVEFTKPLETVSSMRNIGNILEDNFNVGKSDKSEGNSVTPGDSNGTRKNSTGSQQVDRHNYYQSSLNDPNVSKLPLNENTQEMPSRPPRTKRRDPTEVLIERSQLIHNKKQEFMIEKLYGNNPYLKKTLVQDFDEHPIQRNQRNAANDTSEPVLEANTDPTQDAGEAPRNNNKKSCSSHSVTPPTTNLNVFDLFSRSSTENKKSANGKDGCIIS